MCLSWGFLDPLYLGYAIYISATPKHRGYPWAIGRRAKSENVKVVIIVILDVENDGVDPKLIRCV